MTKTSGEQWWLRPDQAAVVEPGATIIWQDDRSFVHWALIDLVRVGIRMMEWHHPRAGPTATAPLAAIAGFELPRLLPTDFSNRSSLASTSGTAQTVHPHRRLEAHAHLARFITGMFSFLDGDQESVPTDRQRSEDRRNRWWRAWKPYSWRGLH